MLPRELTDLLKPWLLISRNFLRNHLALFGTAGWQPFNASTYCMYYVELVQCHHLRLSGKYVHINPQKTRHMFVEWLRSQVLVQAE